MTGEIYGKLTVLERVKNPKKGTRWRCRCSCGRETIVTTGNITNGHTKSCGRCHEIISHGDYLEYRCKSGKTFLFDAEDLPIINQSRWCVDSAGYVQGVIDHRRVKLHRVLMKTQGNAVVDHINGDPSDCRKSNLRITSQHQNTMNNSLPKNSSTGYKGVCFDRHKRKYMAHIHPNGRMIFLGYFDKPKDAAMAYDEAALRYFGEYARPNFAREECQDEQILAVG